MHIRDYLAVLELVNEERLRMGLPELERLPSGIPRNSRGCVIANAIPGARVGSERILGSTMRRMSREVRSFVAEFDRNHGSAVDPGALVEGGIEDDKGCLVLA